MMLLRATYAVLTAGSVLMLERPSLADDGAYGRLEGDLDVRAHAGVALGDRGAGFAAGVSALYLGTLGAFAHYTDSLVADSLRVSRSISTGIHVAPLFLARYGSNLERGPATLDLAIDSLGLEFGALWDQRPNGTWTAALRPGLEFAINLSIPLFAKAAGPFVGMRGALRIRPFDFPGPGGALDADINAALSFAVGWRHIALTHLVDSVDRAQRW